MRYFLAMIVAIVLCMIATYAYAADGDVVYAFTAEDINPKRSTQRTIRAVCIMNMQFLINDQGELTQVLTPVVDTITTYQCASGNGGYCYPTKNYVHSALPMACQNPYPGAKKPY